MSHEYVCQYLSFFRSNVWTSVYIPVSPSQWFLCSWHQKCEVRLLREKKTVKWTRSSALFPRPRIQEGNGTSFPLWQSREIRYSGSTCLFSRVHLLFYKWWALKRQAWKLLLWASYSIPWFYWEKCLQKWSFHNLSKLFSGGHWVESCLNSAEGEPWVTLLSIASFLVNEIWHRQWHRS